MATEKNGTENKGAQDGFQARRIQWASMVAAVHTVVMSAASELAKAAIGIILDYKRGLPKDGWNRETWTEQTGLLDSAAKQFAPDRPTDNAGRSAYHIRAYVCIEALRPLLGEKVDSLSYRFVANYIVGWILQFNPIDLETYVKEIGTDDAAKRIKSDWKGWVTDEKHGLRRYLDDPSYSQAEFIRYSKAYADDLAAQKRKQETGVDPVAAAEAAALKKQKAERSAAKRKAENSITDVLSEGILSAADTVKMVLETARALKLETPYSFNPETATNKECANLLEAMNRAGNHNSIRFMATASAKMVELLEGLSKIGTEPDTATIPIGKAI
jgi:hypothetical protein